MNSVGDSGSVFKPFKENWIGAIHTLILTVAIITVGVWTIYNFWVLDQEVLARQQVKKYETEISLLKEQLRGSYSVNVKLDSKIVKLDGKRGVIVDVTIENVGSKKVTLALGVDALTIYKLKSSGDKLMATDILSPKYYNRISNNSSVPHETFKSQIVKVGSTKNLSYYSDFSEDGVYYIRFSAGLDENLKKEMVHAEGQAMWFASSYIHVESDVVN